MARVPFAPPFKALGDNLLFKGVPFAATATVCLCTDKTWQINSSHKLVSIKAVSINNTSVKQMELIHEETCSMDDLL